MKRYLSFLLVLLLVVGAGLTGCGNDTTEPQQEETPPVQTEISTLKGEYQGLADGSQCRNYCRWRSAGLSIL